MHRLCFLGTSRLCPGVHNHRLRWVCVCRLPLHGELKVTFRGKVFLEFVLSLPFPVSSEPLLPVKIRSSLRRRFWNGSQSLRGERRWFSPHRANDSDLHQTDSALSGRAEGSLCRRSAAGGYAWGLPSKVRGQRIHVCLPQLCYWRVEGQFLDKKSDLISAHSGGLLKRINE